MTQITISKPSSALWIATFNNPPINLIDPDTIGELQELIATLESDAEVKVVVFRSADPDFFLAHWDVLADKAKLAAKSVSSYRMIRDPLSALESRPNRSLQPAKPDNPHFLDCPLTRHDAGMPKSTRMTHLGHRSDVLV